MKKRNDRAGALAVALLGIAGLSACGSDRTSPGGEQGGTGAVGGQSSTGGGTSTSNGLAAAMSLNFLSGGTNCPIAAGYDDFPSVAGGHPVTASGATATTPNNVTSPRGLVTLECTIGGSELQGSITLGGGTVSMAFIASRTGTTPGNILYVPPTSRVTYGGTSAVLCDVETISTTTTGGLYSVSCPTLTGTDGSTCVLGLSFVYFRGCTLQ